MSASTFDKVIENQRIVQKTVCAKEVKVVKLETKPQSTDKFGRLEVSVGNDIYRRLIANRKFRRHFISGSTAAGRNTRQIEVLSIGDARDGRPPLNRFSLHELDTTFVREIGLFNSMFSQFSKSQESTTIESAAKWAKGRHLKELLGLLIRVEPLLNEIGIKLVMRTLLPGGVASRRNNLSNTRHRTEYVPHPEEKFVIGKWRDERGESGWFEIEHHFVNGNSSYWLDPHQLPWWSYIPASPNEGDRIITDDLSEFNRRFSLTIDYCGVSDVSSWVTELARIGVSRESMAIDKIRRDRNIPLEEFPSDVGFISVTWRGILALLGQRYDVSQVDVATNSDGYLASGNLEWGDFTATIWALRFLGIDLGLENIKPSRKKVRRLRNTKTKE